MEIITTDELASVCNRLAKHRVITVDTEFLRETTYYPLLCVVQMASADEAVVIDALAGDRPQAVLRPDGQRERAESLPCRASGYRDHLSSREHHSPSGIRHAGRGHGAGLSAIRLPTISLSSASPAIVPIRPTVSPTGRTVRCRRTRSPMPSPMSPICATCRSARCRSQEARPQRMGQRGDGYPDLSKDLRRPARARMGTAQNPRPQAEGSRGMMEVAAWREQEAQSRDVPRSRVLKDDAIGDIATHAPTSLERLAKPALAPRGSTSRNGARTSSPR